MTQITKKEFDELYGDVEVEFVSYYKYTFVFAGDTPDGLRVSLSVGGCADDIYRMDVAAGVKEKVRDIYATYAGVYSEDGEDPIHSYSDW